ncbi:hypothetical protein N7532_009803 [Penicillium argentinense]|uniref:Zn(2)-C6 fungal-type domain-containing protein n=1 Tax=Penicillium argentinense TaxID=1131581 RepID=A0A9W9END1_9EURO|nr:uncharacterized protein N7532_009803 [Penicillium argentinense]KAJ5085032.1 hypothetical protein N7532_009803 [Penicillium argentinense]
MLLGMSPVANCFASALAYGITQIKGPLEPWRYLFIIEGAPTVLFSVVVFFFLPDSPGSAKFLDETEQTAAVERLQTIDRTAKNKIQWQQVLSGLKDYKNYVHMTVHFCCNYSFAGLSNFLPTILETMGYDSVNAQGLAAPPYLGSFLCCIFAAIVSDRWGNRGWVVTFFAAMGTTGYLVLTCVQDETKTGARYAGVWLATCGIFPALAINITWMLNNQGGESKKGVGMALLAVFGQCSSLISSSVFPDSDAPMFTKGCALGSAFTGLIMLLALGLHLKLTMENKRRDREYGEVDEHDRVDVTDGRYIWPDEARSRSRLFEKAVVPASPQIGFSILHTPMDKRKPPRSRALHDYEFQRAYKACIPCSWRKVKCEPSEGEKCVRCSKKRIDCIFTSKKPWSRAPKDDQRSRRYPAREDIIHEQRSVIRAPSSTFLRPKASRSQSASHDHAGTKDGHLPTSMLQKVVSNNKDAMDILFEAALREESQQNTEQETATPTPVPRPLATADTVQIWNACRFVKMGWFSAHEAMTLVDLFFENLNPLSPILTDFFASRKNQFYLVTQEPMLCCTILMISSRYHNLPGVGGHSRAFFIHHRLWQHCQHLLLRVTLGQEKISKARTRNLGSIEAFLLMSEWHPRSLQFPPDTDGWDSDFIMTHLDARDPPLIDEEVPVSARWREDVVEPTKRFERFPNPVICWASMRNWMHFSDAFGYECLYPDRAAAVAAEKRQRLGIIHEIVDRHYENVEFDDGRATSLMSAPMSFSTADRFMSIVEENQILIANWRQQNLSSAEPGTTFLDILFIEYQYLRVLVNSVGMQVVLQRVLTHDNPHSETTIDHSFIERTRRLNMTGREYGFIEEVIDGCCQTLEKVALLGNTGALHYSPMRILFRTISSSIFLMKALALGVRNSKLQEALQILDRAIAALQDNNQDDTHLKSQYAALLQTQAARLRRSLVSSNPPAVQTRPDPHGGSHAPATPLSISQPLMPGEGAMVAGLDLETISSFDMNDWLSLPFDPSMAPFGPYEGDLGVRLDGVDLDLDFIWQLPP